MCFYSSEDSSSLNTQINCVLAHMMLMSERTNNFSVLLTAERLMMDIALITSYVGVASDPL